MPLTTFPDTYATLPTATLMDAFGSGPARLERAVDGLTEAQLRSRPIPDKWSILEIALHVADSELMGATRIRLACVGLDPAQIRERRALLGLATDAAEVRLEKRLF
jgi:hypothetical protein